MSTSIAILIPVHFPDGVSADLIRATLLENLRGQDRFCPPDRVFMPVELDSRAHQVLHGAPEESALAGASLIELKRNLGKAGAVVRGLQAILESDPPEWILTRDCDTDHDVADIPRFLRMADLLGSKMDPDLPFVVIGARPSWEKPMGWLRQEWERLTNRVLLDCVEFLTAQSGSLVDRRFWNGYPLDLQSGYRLYNRRAASLAVEALSHLPERPEVYTFACEMLPFVEISLVGGLVAQVQTTTRIGQPFSSYADVSLSGCYGELLRFTLDRYRIPSRIALQAFDNRLAASSLFFSEHREEALRCRSLIEPQAPPPLLPSFV